MYEPNRHKDLSTIEEMLLILKGGAASARKESIPNSSVKYPCRAHLLLE